MGEFSFTHLLLVALVILIFFGPSRLPALGQSIGKAIRGFKQGLHEIDAEAKPVTEPSAAQLKAATPAQVTQGTAQNTAAQTQATETNKV